MARSVQMETRDQVRKLTGGVNMLNKVSFDRVRQQHKRTHLKSAKNKILLMNTSTGIN